MKRTLYLTLHTLLLLILIPLAGLTQVASVPRTLTFQGRLAKPDGTPVADGNYSLIFSLWNVASGGTAGTNRIWTQTINNLPVRNGVFATLLSLIPPDAFTSNAWLEMQFVGSASPLSPRQPLVSVPYAFKADSVRDGAIGASSLASSAVTSAKIADGTILGADIASATITADKLASGTLNSLAWLLGGNSGTNPATQYIGTTDSQPLSIRTGGVERIRVGTNGFVGIGRATQVTGNEFFGVTAPNTTGFGGMYLRNSGENTRPFYGYSRNGAVDAYHFVDNAGVWTLVTGLDQTTALRLWQAGDTNFNGVNIASGPYSQVGTGVYGATVFGGDYFAGAEPNSVLSHGGTVGGGASNTAGGPDAMSSRYATVGGGIGNRAISPAATVAGGTTNTAGPGWYAFAGGGYSNNATGFWSVIPGGSHNEASGYYSFAAGQNARALHNGTFVWANGNTDFSGTDFASTAANQFLVRAPGGVGIGTNAPSAQLDVNGNIRSRGGDFILNGRGGGFGNGGGAGRALVDTGNGTQVGYGGLVINFFNDYGKVWVDSDLQVSGVVHQSSDARYKRDITTLTDPLEAILNLRGVSYLWDEKAFPGKKMSTERQIGFVAQEVEKVLPELVTTDANGYKSVAYQNAVPVLVEAIKAQQKQIELLKRDNDALKADRENLKARLDAIEAALTNGQALNASRHAPQK